MFIPAQTMYACPSKHAPQSMHITTGVCNVHSALFQYLYTPYIHHLKLCVEAHTFTERADRSVIAERTSLWHTNPIDRRRTRIVSGRASRPAFRAKPKQDYAQHAKRMEWMPIALRIILKLCCLSGRAHTCLVC